MLCSLSSPPATASANHHSFPLKDATNATGSQRSCKADIVSFSWSDFPILGQGSTRIPALVEIEDSWSDTSSDDSSNTSSSSDDSASLVGRHSSASISSLVEEEEDVAAVASRKPATPRHQVRFGNALRIRTYDVTLGDHPCCMGGMALTCDWTYSPEDECIDLDVYERYAPKRSMAELRLSYQERRERLQATTGLSPAQLLQVEYAMMCADQDEPMHALRPSASVKTSLQELSHL